MITDDLLVRTLSPHIPLSIVRPSSSRLSHRFSKRRYKLGKFILGEVIGQGRLGEVKLASYGLINVAIKLLPREALDEAALVRLGEEMKALMALQICPQPHIIRIQEIVADGKYIGMVMDWACKGDLFHYLAQNGRVSEEQAQLWMAQLVSAVDEMHTRCYIHRDIKLENLLIDEHNNLVLTDFEMCSNFRRQGFSAMNHACGSATYCPPEAIRLGQHYDGCKADVWALGIVLYACVAGYLPFDDHEFHGKSPENICLLYKHIEASDLAFPSWFSKDLQDILIHMLNKDQNSRATIVDVKLHPWLRDHRHLWDRPESNGSDVRFDSLVSLESLRTVNDTLADCTKVLRGPIIWDPHAGCDCE